MDARTYSMRATPKSQRTRARILDAAMRLFAEIGYHAASNAVIADAAQLTRGAMLYHFATREELVEAAVAHIDLARARGAPAAEVGLSSGEGLSVTVRDGACETVEHERDKSLGITIHLDGRKGSATTSDFSSEALRETVDAALAIARAAEPDSYAGLAAPEYLAREIPDLDQIGRAHV